MDAKKHVCCLCCFDTSCRHWQMDKPDCCSSIGNHRGSQTALDEAFSLTFVQNLTHAGISFKLNGQRLPQMNVNRLLSFSKTNQLWLSVSSRDFIAIIKRFDLEWVSQYSMELTHRMSVFWFWLSKECQGVYTGTWPYPLSKKPHQLRLMLNVKAQSEPLSAQWEFVTPQYACHHMCCEQINSFKLLFPSKHVSRSLPRCDLLGLCRVSFPLKLWRCPLRAYTGFMSLTIESNVVAVALLHEWLRHAFVVSQHRNFSTCIENRSS